MISYVNNVVLEKKSYDLMRKKITAHSTVELNNNIFNRVKVSKL